MKRTGSRLNDRVTYQEPVTSKSEYGEVSTEWQDVATLYAAVIPESGAERMRAGQVEAVEQFKVETRPDSRITAKGRFLHRGRVLEIHAVAEFDRRWMEFACSRIA